MNSIQTLYLNKFGGNPIQTKLTLIYIWINPGKNEKLHYSIGPHCSPRPQWLTGPKTSPHGPNHGLWLAHAVGCTPSSRPTRGHRAVHFWRLQHGEALTVVLVAYRRWDVDLHLLQLTIYKLQHRDLGGRGLRGGLTGEAVGLTVADAVEGGT
jgi:hypothetical protein